MSLTPGERVDVRLPQVPANRFADVEEEIRQAKVWLENRRPLVAD